MQQALDRAYPTSTLRDKAIHVSREAGAEEDGNRPPQREVADQDPLHRILGNPLRCAVLTSTAATPAMAATIPSIAGLHVCDEIPASDKVVVVMSYSVICAEDP